MSQELVGPATMTVDELAAATGLTVRTTRYYASLGLIPPAQKRGRVAYYDERHRARLELVRALQEHGFTLHAVERYLARLPVDASAEDLDLRRTMLTSWTSVPPEPVDAEALERRAGRRLRPDEVALLVRIGLLEETDDGWLAAANLQTGLDLLDLGIPLDSVGAAGDAIERHMTALVEELTTILRDGVLEPYRLGRQGAEDAERLEQTLPRLRRLTLESVVATFQRAANAVIGRSLDR
jgi:DNA-binding transcriptional MerR regulator